MSGERYTHIFFDLDGTLWDFYKNSTQALTILYKKYALNEWNVKCKKFTAAFHQLNEKLWQQFSENKISKDNLRTTRFPSLFSKLQIYDDKLAAAVSEEYMNACPNMPYLIPNAMEILEYLSNKYKLHIITNGFADAAFRKLHTSGIIKYFKNVISPDIANSRKPEGLIFEYALNTARTHSNQAIMVGNDFEVDIKGAHLSGIDQIYYNPNNTSSPFRPTYMASELKQLKDIL